MMGKFNFEDYRQPWETGPHWELKKEFIETYEDMFEEDRLLCLAQAYANVILMNCSYPDPVMRQISELSKPLELRKKFQEISSNTEASTAKNEHSRVSEKLKSIYGQTGRPFKQMKFCSSQEQSELSLPSDPSNLHQSPSEEFKSTSLSVPSQQGTQSPCVIRDHLVSKACAIPSLNATKEPEMLHQNEDDTFLDKEKEEKIVSALGLPLIINFVGMMETAQDQIKNEIGSFFHVINKVGIKDCSCFTFDIDPDSPAHARVYIAKFFIKDCEIASETASKKKEAKALCTKAAINTLTKLGTSHVSSIKVKSEINSESKCKPSVNKRMDCMEVLQLFSKSIVNKINKKNKPAEFTLKNTASLLGMDDCIVFDVSSYEVSPTETEYCCKFFLRDVLISCGKANMEDNAKNIAADLGLVKLSDLSDCEIQNGELVKKLNGTVNQTSNLESTSYSLSHSGIETNPFEKPHFILNQTMYNSSLRDGFVLVEKEKYKEDIQMYAKIILNESASFNRTVYEYQFEDVPGTVPPSKKALLLIGGVVISSGVSSTKEEAKTIACVSALNDLKKKYYTLRIKEEYVEGFIITRNQVFDGESFSSNVISESNIGCKMLKSMGWTGGGLGEKGIAEPIQATANLSFGRGLGFGTSNSKGGNNPQLFKKRLEAMLRDFCQSENYSDLVFSKDFTKEERKQIHQFAGRLHLHTQSRGVGNERFLTIRQKYETVKLLKFLAKNGGSNSKFQLIDDSRTSLQV